MRRALMPLLLRAAALPRPTFRTRPSPWRRQMRQLVSASDLHFGQALHETHPHLIQAGQLTPGISALEYHYRRAALARKLPRGGVAILAASELKYRSGPVFYPFHQDPNFFYLTGFNEPDAVAVIGRSVAPTFASRCADANPRIVKGRSDVEFTFHLFVRPKDEQAERWDGARSGVQAAQDVFNADEAGDIGDISTSLAETISEATVVYTDVGSFRRKSAFSRFFAGSCSPNIDGFAKLLRDSTVKPLRPFMNELRLTKSPAELDCMRKAGSISGAVITDAMKRHYSSEKQLWSDLAYGFSTRGLDGEAYVPVIGGGTNALSIHYVRNDALLQDGDVVLVDAGGEYGSYITDITRTWPVNGKFTAPQKDMYSMILGVQKSCISLSREDADMTLDKLHRVAESGLKRGLQDLGFNASHSDMIDVLFPHHVGHFIGLDVHDAPGFSRTERLRENQCITIEPGIYVPPDDERWPEHFRGLGIRIEDSLRVGKEKVEVLTSTAVKEVEEIESLRAE